MSIKYPIICKKQDQIQMRFQVLVSLFWSYNGTYNGAL